MTPNWVAGGFSPPISPAPRVRVRKGRFLRMGKGHRRMTTSWLRDKPPTPFHPVGCGTAVAVRPARSLPKVRAFTCPTPSASRTSQMLLQGTFTPSVHAHAGRTPADRADFAALRRSSPHWAQEHLREIPCNKSSTSTESTVCGTLLMAQTSHPSINTAACFVMLSCGVVGLPFQPLAETTGVTRPTLGQVLMSTYILPLFAIIQRYI